MKSINKFLVVMLCFVLFTTMAFALSACIEKELKIAKIEVSGPSETAVGEFDYNDYTVKVIFDDGSTKDIKLNKDLLSASDRELLDTPGTHTITVKYNDVTCTFTVTIKGDGESQDKGIRSIAISGPNEIVAGNIDYKDFSLVITYEDDSTTTIELREEFILEEDRAKLNTVGSHSISITYNGTTTTWNITVKENESTGDNIFEGVTFDDATYTYDGTSKSIEVKGVPDGATVKYNVSNNYTNAGVYPIEATISKEGYKTLVLTATLTINKATYDMSGVEFDDKTVVYNGEVQRIEIIGSLPQGVTVSYDNNENINVGTYEVVAKFTGDSNNYEAIADMTATLTVNKATYDMSGVEFVDKTVVYNGKVQRIEISGSLPQGVTVTYENNDKTDEGTYEVIAKFTGDSNNYEAIADMTATLTIIESDFEGVTFKDATYIYDGREKSIEVNGVPDGATVKYNVSNSYTNAGVYPIEATISKEGYKTLVLTATLTINKATYDMSGVEFVDKTVVYNGEVQRIETSGNLPQGVTVSYDNNENINVGTYEVVAKFTGDHANYNVISDKTAQLIINKAAYDMSGVEFEGKTVVYNGEVQRIEISGNLPQGVTVTYENNDNTDVGTYKVIAKFTGDSNNYETIADMTATLTINKATYDMSGVEFVDKTFSYDGTEKELIISGSLPNGVTVSYINNKLTEAGTITATAIFTGDSNNYEPISDKTAILTVVRDGLYYKVIFVLSETEKVQVVVKNNEGVIDSDIPTIPDRLGYDGAWDKDFSCVTEDIEVYINYTPIEYSITYVCGSFGTNNADNPTTYTIESPVITLENAITDAIGTIFDGWYTTPNYEEETKVTSLETGHYGDLILYAKWIRYCVEQAEGFDIDYSLENYELPAIVAVVENAKTLMTLSSMIKVSDGCTWELSRDIEGTEIIKTKNVSLNTGHNIYYITVWHGDTYSLAYIVDIYRLDNVAYSFVSDGSVFVDEAYAEETTFIDKPETDPQKTGHTFIGWSVNGEVVDFPYELRDDTVFTAEFKANTYTISYLFGNEVVYQEMVEFGSTYTLYEYVTADYEIVAWILDGSELSPNTQITLTVDHDIVYTAKTTYLSNEFTYSINDNNATITGYNGADTSIVIPNYIKIDSTYYTVTSIGSDAFSECNGLTSITIPDSVTSIGNYAFYMCRGITSITIPDSVTSIGNYAFEGCSGLKDVYYTGDIAGWCNIQFNISASNPMYYADNLYINGELLQGELIIPDSVTSIGDYAFYNCSGLTSITIPDSVTSIGNYAFEGCTGLVSITIPFIGKNADGTGSTHFGYIFGINIYQNCYYVPESLREVIITGGTSIGDRAFSDCAGLTSITIPDSVTSIGDSAFEDCSGLTSITIPDSVTSIGSSAFSGCSGLTIYCEVSSKPDGWDSNWNYSNCPVVWDCNNNEIADDGYIYAIIDGLKYGLKDGEVYIAEQSQAISGELVIADKILYKDQEYIITGIKNDAFYNCRELTSITMPAGLTSIGSSAFSGCTAEILWDNPTITYIGSYAFKGYQGTSITIPDSVTSIGDDAFYGCIGLTSITIGNGVKSIGISAFSGCSGLTSITIPDSVTSIGNYAFYGCSGLTSITIPNSVTSIGEWTFSNCSGLTSITIPDSVTSIGEGAFYNCSGLIDVYYTGDIAGWCNIQFDNISSNPMDYADNLYINGELVTDLVIPDSVTSIGKYAFYNCSGLTSITIPDSVTSIGSYAFYDCSGLTSITIPESVTSIGEWAFYSCSELTDVYYTGDIAGWCNIQFNISASNPMYYADNLYINGELVTDLVIPDSVTSIGNYAFYNCSGLTSITIPDSVTSIGNYTFYNCSGLESITIPDSVTSIGSSAFSGCSGLTSITIPFVGQEADGTGATYLGYIFGASSYSYNSSYVPESLREVIITGGTSIGNYAFYGCSGLTSITIPDSVTIIGYGAFYNCSGLTSITIPDSVTSIGNYAFYGCSGLESITIPASVTSIGSSAFEGCSGLTSITIPFVGQEADGTGATYLGYIFGASGYTDNSSYVPESLREVIITGGTSIGDRAFSNCSELTSITIPNGVTSIGKYAFDNCSGLESITIPYVGEKADGTGATHFGYIFGAYSYSNNSYYVPESLREVIITGGTSIGDRAFTGCSGLTSITIPDNVTSIGSSAFSSCSGLTSITIPDSVTSIGDWAFYGCSGLTSITIPASVSSIGKYAFDNCTAEIVWDNPTITNIGSYSYAGYQGTSITIPDSVTSIGINAFYGCSGLTSITIPDSVTSIGINAFYGCSGLTIYCEVGSKPDGWDSNWNYSNCPVVWDCNNNEIADDGYIYAIIDGLKYGLKDGEAYIAEQSQAISGEVVIADKVSYKNQEYIVNSITNNAFYDCTGLTSITIPDSVASIGDRAFYGCTGLTSITIPDSVTSIGDGAFAYCSGLTSITVAEGNSKYHSQNNCIIETASKTLIAGCKTSIIPDDGSVTSIGSNAFSGCSGLESITIPASVTSIGDDAFRDCSGLTSITIPDNVTRIGNYAFLGCSGLTSITIPDSVTSIGSTAFAYCSGLTSITIPDNVTRIGNYAFLECRGLTSITIPNSVTSIGERAFYNCSGLTSITIPDSVTSIGSYAFSGCSNLTNVTFESPQGWWCSTSSSATSGTSISSSDLEDPVTAAEYLTDTYSNYYWKRS